MDKTKKWFQDQPDKPGGGGTETGTGRPGAFRMEFEFANPSRHSRSATWNTPQEALAGANSIASNSGYWRDDEASGGQIARSLLTFGISSEGITAGKWSTTARNHAAGFIRNVIQQYQLGTPVNGKLKVQVWRTDAPELSGNLAKLAK